MKKSKNLIILDYSDKGFKCSSSAKKKNCLIEKKIWKKNLILKITRTFKNAEPQNQFNNECFNL